MPKLMPLSGAVTLNGKPLSGAALMFIPLGDTRGTGATGYTKQDGTYEAVDRHGAKGVPAGEYRVAITKLVMPDGSDFPLDSNAPPIDSPARQLLPDKYASERWSILKATVPEGGAKVNFDLQCAPSSSTRGGLSTAR